MQLYTPAVSGLNQENKDVDYGINQVLPLVESRACFTEDIWELDNVSRGNEQVEYNEMEETARKLAAFEEKVVYYGLEKAGIPGLKNESEYAALELPDSTDALLNAFSKQLAVFKKNGIEGPYSLVVNPNEWERLTGELDGYPLRKQIKLLLDGSIIFHPSLMKPFLFPSEAAISV